MKRLLLLALLAGCSGPQMMPGTAPKIVSTTPPAMGHDVSLTTSIVIEFSAAMDVATVGVTLSPNVPLQAAAWNEARTQGTFTPEAPLAFATQYTVRVQGSDPDGRKLSGDTVFAFTTAEAPETTAPTLVSSTPANGAMGVAVTSTLQLVFSEKMDTASVSIASVPAVDWGAAAWSAGDTMATFTPVQALAASTAYQLTINGADLAGNPLSGADVSFTTGSVADTTAPTVSSTSPAPGATGVSTTAQPSVSFSEPMAAGTVMAMTVSPDAGCTPALDGTGTLLTCTTAAPLAASTQYTVTIAAAQARDLAMNPMAAPFSFSFTTGATADTTPPTVVSMRPNDGGQPLNPTMVAVFSEPMDKASTQGAVSTSPSRQLFFAWNGAGDTLSITADGGFPYAQAVSWSVSTAARDVAGNALAASGNAAFTVRRLCTATIRSDTATDGTVSATSTGTGRPSYAYVPTQNRARVGRTASMSAETLSRGLYVFPVGNASGCSTTGISKDALGLTQATLRAAQASVTGSPYGTVMRLGQVTVDWLPFDGDAGVVFTGMSPCRAASCTRVLSSNGIVGHKSVDVTEMLEAALDARRGNNYAVTLRLVNAYAEGLTTSSSDYSDFTDGFAPDGGAALDVSYEVP